MGMRDLHHSAGNATETIVVISSARDVRIQPDVSYEPEAKKTAQELIDSPLADDLRAVETWENEGGLCSE